MESHMSVINYQCTMYNEGNNYQCWDLFLIAIAHCELRIVHCSLIYTPQRSPGWGAVTKGGYAVIFISIKIVLIGNVVEFWCSLLPGWGYRLVTSTGNRHLHLLLYTFFPSYYTYLDKLNKMNTFILMNVMM